jgi:hypothetical protein
VARPADTAFKHIAHTQFAPDLLGLDPLSLIGECGIALYHQHPREPRQIGCQILGDPVREILLLTVVAEVGERPPGRLSIPTRSTTFSAGVRYY